MRQLLQKLRDGRLVVLDVPAPPLRDARVLVRNRYSVVSAGTEGSTVRSARKTLLGKARERPDAVRQLLEVTLAQGPLLAYRAASKKLEAYSPLGYSSAGVVEEVGARVQGLKVGDPVACAGVGYANHAEFVSVPENLCVRLPPAADLRLASYNTLGAIAVQGFRQADLRFGERCVVIGLGLLGQLTGLIARASGVRVVGVDVAPHAVASAKGGACDATFLRHAPDCVSAVLEECDGVGADAVIITAATDSTDPVNFAGTVARKRGKVVVVGAVPTGFDRDPHWYRKELELRMSCSYGPGRYDPQYEERGIDYPLPYVRWTERRNMSAFQEAVHSGRVDISHLTTHEFALEGAPDAYDLILARREPVLGVVIRYPADAAPARPLRTVELSSVRPRAQVNLAVVGAGSYAVGSLLPHIPRSPAIKRHTVAAASGASCRRTAERFGFAQCSTDTAAVLDSPDIDTVMIATRHDSHAALVATALTRGLATFVEKPLALNEAELNQLLERISSVPSGAGPLWVGYNRRFAPLVDTLKASIARGPLSMVYRVNAGPLPAGSWIGDPAVGGGRVIGEMCHFVDLMTHLCAALPVRVSAARVRQAGTDPDTLSAVLEFADGSIGTLTYVSNGSKTLFKELLEVHWGGCSAVLTDFRRLSLFTEHTRKTYRRLTADKGQGTMVRRFFESVAKGEPSAFPLAELVAVSRTTFRLLDAVSDRQSHDV
jgi:polar amino acid transport system substrate-binding protein